MKPSTLLLLFLAFIMLTPPSKKTEKEVIGIDLLRSEGYVAFILNEKAVDDTVAPVKGCGGTRQIKAGDGTILPCPGCPDCKKSTTAPMMEAPREIEIIKEPDAAPVIEEPPVEEIDKKKVTPSQEQLLAIKGFTTVVFTDPSWCGPCKMLETYSFPILKKSGWIFSHNEIKVANIILLDDDHPLYKEISNEEKVPNFFVFKDGQVVGHFAGYYDGISLAKNINKIIVDNR